MNAKKVNADLKDFILRGNSKSYTDFVADIVTRRPELVSELWDIYLAEEEPVSRKAAWILDTASEERPEWAEPYLPRLIPRLSGFGHDGLKRHGMRMISRLPFPPGSEGELLDVAFRWLISPDESVAVKMFCMLVLYRISENEPDILQELFDTIEFQMADATPGLRNIGGKMMQKIDHDIMARKMGRIRS
jgi:hypothetical protein